MGTSEKSAVTQTIVPTVPTSTSPLPVQCLMITIVCPVEQLPLTQALTEANAPSMLNMQPLSTSNSQNALPYFPILNQPWTFVAVPRNPPAPSRSTVPPVDPNNIAQDDVLMCPSPTSSAQQPPVPQGPHPRTQLTLQDTSCVNVSISFSCDQ